MTRNILSFRPFQKVIMGGHRAYNLDKALSDLGVNMTIVEGWENNPAMLLTPRQMVNRLKLVKYIKNKNKYSRFLVHGVQPKSFLKILKNTNIPILLDFRDDPLLQGELIGCNFSEKRVSELKKLIETSLELSDTILFPSKTLMQYYPENVQKKSVVIMNATDTDHFKSYPIPDNQVIGSLSGMVQYSGYDLLIESCKLVKKEFKDLKVKLLDSHTSKHDNYAQKIKNQYRYDWIEFVEETSYDHIKSFFQECLLIVYSSPKVFYLDAATPLKIFDTMASGRPFVATNLKEISNIANNEKCGLICEHNPETMAEQISKILRSRTLAEELGRNGREAAEERHSWRVRAKMLMDYIY